jgi:hypothetical protein
MDDGSDALEVGVADMVAWRQSAPWADDATDQNAMRGSRDGEGSGTQGALGALWPHDELNVAIQHLEEPEHLVEGFPVVRTGGCWGANAAPSLREAPATTPDWRPRLAGASRLPWSPAARPGDRCA